MNKNKKLLTFVGIAVVAIVAVLLIIRATEGEKSDTGQTTASQMVSEIETTPEPETQRLTLSDAQDMLGMNCQGSDVSMDCDWNDVRYEFMVPSNWKQDMNLRMQACNEGYINTGYNMVSDGSSWYATTDFEEDNTKLVNALNEIGFESQVVSYCQ